MYIVKVGNEFVRQAPTGLTSARFTPEFPDAKQFTYPQAVLVARELHQSFASHSIAVYRDYGTEAQRTAWTNQHSEPFGV